MQADLFSARSQASTVTFPPAPALEPHDWPYPGMTPEDSARSAASQCSAYIDVVAAVILRRGGDVMTSAEVLAAVPEDWRALLGQWAHGCLSASQGAMRGIDVKYVHHEGAGGFHFEYRAQDEARRA